MMSMEPNVDIIFVTPHGAAQAMHDSQNCWPVHIDARYQWARGQLLHVKIC